MEETQEHDISPLGIKVNALTEQIHDVTKVRLKEYRMVFRAR